EGRGGVGGGWERDEEVGEGVFTRKIRGVVGEDVGFGVGRVGVDGVFKVVGERVGVVEKVMGEGVEGR
ncbi:hypothetical protein, partial [Neisseria sicca]|uniref:hypothetical protein n=1 Tax=Neisseria sicca TaxID=490 RepID=UPI001C98F847